jgi:hypothetical protein
MTASSVVAAAAAMTLVATGLQAATVEPIGSAYAVKATILGIGIPASPLVQGTAANNYTDSDVILNFTPSVLGSSLSFGVASSSTSGDATTGGVTSTGSIENAKLTVGLPPFGVPSLFSFGVDSLKATCTSTPTSFTGSSTLVGGSLSITGFGTVEVPVNPAPNTGVDLGALGKVLFNEQVTNPDGSITVNAFHLQLATQSGVDIVLGSATCGPTTNTPPVEVPNTAVAVGSGTVAAAAAGGVVLATLRRRNASDR